jgi:hypothetical protein
VPRKRPILQPIIGGLYLKGCYFEVLACGHTQHPLPHTARSRLCRKCKRGQMTMDVDPADYTMPDRGARMHTGEEE